MTEDFFFGTVQKSSDVVLDIAYFEFVNITLKSWYGNSIVPINSNRLAVRVL
jgi:hypothetical protein